MLYLELKNVNPAPSIVRIAVSRPNLVLFKNFNILHTGSSFKAAFFCRCLRAAKGAP
jgi:hypothetical protein